MQPSRRCASTNGSIMPFVCACSRIQRSDKIDMRECLTGRIARHQFAADYFCGWARIDDFRQFGRTAPSIRAQLIHSCATFVPLDVGPHERRSLVMAEVIRIAESASERRNPVPSAERRGRGGAARRADDRQPAGRGRPAQAQGRIISSSRCTAASTKRSCKLTDSNRVANPVTLAPAVRSRRER